MWWIPGGKKERIRKDKVEEKKNQTLTYRQYNQNAKCDTDKYQSTPKENGWKQLQKNSLEVGLRNISLKSEA